MGIVIDLIIVAIILIVALISAKQGFVRVLIEVVGFVLALLLAFSISAPLADVTYQKFVEPKIVESGTESVNLSTNQTVDEMWKKLPDFVTDNADTLGISKKALAQSLNESSGDGMTAVLKDISQRVIKPIATNVIEMIFSIILIIIFMFIVKILAKVINKMFSFSVVGKLNHFLGGIIGIAKGGIFAILVCEILLLVISFTGGVWIFNNQNIEKTFVFQFLTNVF